MTEHQVPEKKRTVLGLYVTAQEGYKMWEVDPDGTHIVDVRTPEEYIFVGHPAMAKNVPVLFIEYAWDAKKNQPAVVPNPAFAPTVMKAFQPNDTILVMCRSGGRSALAVNGLADAGFTNVYNVIDGFEGDKVDDAGSAFNGKRMRNGWKNSGLPWTYDVDSELLWTSEQLR